MGIGNARNMSRLEGYEGGFDEWTSTNSFWLCSGSRSMMIESGVWGDEEEELEEEESESKDE